MNSPSVRITDVRISNLKNVVYGSLNFENLRKEYKASILGLYGQNGSGKTALIDAIELLKYALSGSSIPDRYIHLINIDSDAATLLFNFELQTPKGTTPVSYQFSVKVIDDVTGRNIELEKIGQPNRRICIFNEILKCPIFGEGVPRMGTLIDTDTKEPFMPRTRRQLFVGDDRKNETNLVVAKKLSSAQSQSFIFSREFLSIIRETLKKTEGTDEALAFYVDLIEKLAKFGNYELFVINTSSLGLLSFDAQPLAFKINDGNRSSLGTMMIPLNGPVVIPKKALEVVTKVINTMNIVLRQIIPELTILIKNLGEQILERGDIGIRIQLISSRSGKEIPLNYESEGIKKILSILQLLIVVYNQSSITVAIDELDNGIFEYLLGELLSIISERGQGQLIFTSHNLRPLETLDRGFIAFTTTNPQNRYVKAYGVKNSNNLRDFYYRDILVGLHKEELYEQTNNAEIALAFREAVDKR